MFQICNAANYLSNQLSYYYNRYFPAGLHFNKSENKLRHFRIFADIGSKKNINTTGIENKNVSGSGQFGVNNLKRLIEKISSLIDINHKKLFIIDLREESHGVINGEPIMWKTENYSDENRGKSVTEIRNNESQRFAMLPRVIFVWKTFFSIPLPSPMLVYSASNEEHQIQRLGNNNINYVRIPITVHQRPTDRAVDEIVELIQDNPDNWLHFHCCVGKERTAVAMAMFDMLHHAKTLTLDEIFKRQRANEGEDFTKICDGSGQEDPDAKEKLVFLQNFYQYCQEADIHTQTWSEWIRTKGIAPREI